MDLRDPFFGIRLYIPGFGYIIIRSPYTPYSIYSRGSIGWELGHLDLYSNPTADDKCLIPLSILS